MAVKVIKLNKSNYSGRGVYGEYVKISERRGVKILYSDGHSSLASLKESTRYKEALQEHNLISAARKVPFVLRSYGVVAIQDGDLLFPGILMTHIEGKLYNELNHFNTVFPLREKLRAKLRTCGVNHNDLHGNNIIVKKHKNRYVAYAIDFSPNYVTLNTRLLKKLNKRRKR